MKPDTSSIRAAAFAGRFYPGTTTSLLETVGRLLEEANCRDRDVAHKIRALVVPHAGYIYSGATAAKAFARIDRESHFDTLFLIGNSHRQSFRGAALCGATAFETPLGLISINQQVVAALRGQPIFSLNSQIHQQEHSLEVLIPFLQVQLNQPFTIVPILLGTNQPETAQQVANQLMPWFNPRNLFIVSTDLSHYPDAHTAQSTDAQTIALVKAGDPGKLHSHLEEIRSRGDHQLLTGMCGEGAVLTLMHLCQHEKNCHFEPVAYSHSGMVSHHETNKVVGYQSLVVVQETEPPFSLTPSDKETLLLLAHQSVESHLNHEPVKGLPHHQNQALLSRQGVFVSIYIDGKLRGCLGRFEPETPLWQTTALMAVEAATSDSRFEPVSARELSLLRIEISVLTPMRRIVDLDDIEVGRHGIYIRKGNHAGTFLPQVAQKMGWNRQEMLSNCSQHKAGLGTDGWRDAEIYIYEAIIIKEE